MSSEVFYVLHWSGWLCVVDAVAATHNAAEGLLIKAEQASPYPVQYEIHDGLPWGNPIFMTEQAKHQLNLLRTHCVIP